MKRNWRETFHSFTKDWKSFTVHKARTDRRKRMKYYKISTIFFSIQRWCCSFSSFDRRLSLLRLSNRRSARRFRWKWSGLEDALPRLEMLHKMCIVRTRARGCAAHAPADSRCQIAGRLCSHATERFRLIAASSSPPTRLRSLVSRSSRETVVNKIYVLHDLSFGYVENQLSRI